MKTSKWTAFVWSLACALVLLSCNRGRGPQAEGATPVPQYPPCDVASKPFEPSNLVQNKGAPVWIRRFGCSGDDRAKAVMFMHDDVIALGSFSSKVSFGGEPINSVGTVDGFVAAWDGRGNAKWVRRLGGINSEAYVTNAVADSAGNIVIAGRFRGVLDAARPSLLSRGFDTFLLNVKKNGQFGWALSFPATTSQEKQRDFGMLAMDGENLGALIVAPGVNNSLLRIGNQGQITTRALLSQGKVTSIGSYQDRSFIAVGYANGSHDQRTSVLLESQLKQPSIKDVERSVFVAKFDSAAKLLWERRWVSDAGVGMPMVVADSFGGAVIGMTFQGVIDVGTGLLRAGYGYDLLLMRLGSQGETMWTRAFDGPQGNEWFRALAVDEMGSIVFGGTFEKAVDFGVGAVMSAGVISGFVARVAPSGHTLWSRVLGARASSVVVESVSIGRFGRVAVAGAYQGWTDLGAGWVPASGQWDGFVALYSDP